jgi:hypothetical protein
MPGRVIRILPPKENFRELLKSPSSISKKAKETDRDLFPDSPVNNSTQDTPPPSPSQNLAP